MAKPPDARTHAVALPQKAQFGSAMPTWVAVGSSRVPFADDGDCDRSQVRQPATAALHGATASFSGQTHERPRANPWAVHFASDISDGRGAPSLTGEAVLDGTCSVLDATCSVPRWSALRSVARRGRELLARSRRCPGDLSRLGSCQSRSGIAMSRGHPHRGRQSRHAVGAQTSLVNVAL